MKTTTNFLRCSWACALLFLCMFVAAQTESNTMNPVYKVSMSTLGYTPKAKKETVGSVLTDLTKTAITGQSSQPQDQYADAVRAAITTGVGRVRRFSVVEGQFVPGEVADAEVAYYVDGTIGTIATTQKTITPEDKKKQPYDVFKGQVSATLHLKDVHTDAVISTETFSVSGSDGSWIETAEGALNDAMNALSWRITNYFNNCFPLRAHIVEQGEVKKEKLKGVFIDIGTAAGAFKEQHYDVYVVRLIAGKEAKHKIGRLRITEVMGDDISQCKVTKGGEEIKAALDDNLMLIVSSTD